MPSSTRPAYALAAFMASAGATHFIAPKPYDSIVPRQLPGSPRAWTYASGAAELACGVAVAVPKTRRAGAVATAALFLAVFPANVQMAYDWRRKPLPLRAGAYARLPLQAPLLAWALKVARGK